MITVLMNRLAPIVVFALALVVRLLYLWEIQETPLVEVLGLDQRNNVNTDDRAPDGRMDPEFIDHENGILWFPDLRPFDPSRTDISGIAERGTQYRDRSLPVVSAENYERPDTLGWEKASDEYPAPSRPETRLLEVVPEIYDLLPNELSLRASEFHIYSIQVTTSP